MVDSRLHSNCNCMPDSIIFDENFKENSEMRVLERFNSTIHVALRWINSTGDS